MTDVFKVVLIGDTNVGKTCIIGREVSNEFYDVSPTASPQAVQINKNVMQSKSVKLDIWDTAGQEQFRSLAPIALRGSSATIIVYSIDKRSSFYGVDEWFAFAKDISPSETNFILVGNKSDLKDSTDQNELTTREEGENKALELGIKFYEVSAKTGENIHELFDEVAEECLFSKINKPSPPELIDGEKQKEKNCSC